MKQIAVLLSGCGYLDGAEIRESICTLLALDSHPVDVHLFALNENQKEVINTLSGQAVSEQRNQLIESARIARGQIKSLEECDPKSYDALVLPGGFGVAKNFCTFAFEGPKGSVHPLVKSKIETFYQNKKPIVALCIAPALLGMIFKNESFEMTLGPQGEAADALVSMGHKHHVCLTNEIHTDQSHKIISSPAYMYDDAKLSDVFSGIQKSIETLIEWL